MWLPWGKSSSRSTSSSSSSSSSASPSNFRCFSSKDLRFLLDAPPGDDDDDGIHRPFTSNNPNVFHRVRTATSIIPQCWFPLNQEEDHDDDNPLPAQPLIPPPEHQEAGNDSPSPDQSETAEPLISIPGAESTVVIYTTSLGVIRSTFEECKEVKMILTGFRVWIDERDVSMEPRFMDELRSVLSSGDGGGAAEGTMKLSLPRVFIGGKYVGGAEEVKQLHEIGELKNMLEGMWPADSGQCEACGGFRFIICEECNGSRRVFTDVFNACAACNPNGLIRCPFCCLPLLPPV